MQTQQTLIGELQLGQRLNHCVHDGKKSEFDLLLSMLSHDITDQDQFKLEQTTAADEKEQSLREKFDLPMPQSLQAETIEQEAYSLQLGQVALEEGLLSARLQHCLSPEPLHFKQPSREGLPMEVYESLSPSIAQRVSGKIHELSPSEISIDQLVKNQQDYQATLITA